MAKEKKKILSISNTGEVEKLGSDAERIAILCSLMTPSERHTYKIICEAIAIQMASGKLTGLSSLIKMKMDLEAKYETDVNDAVRISWDDDALKEAAQG